MLREKLTHIDAVLFTHEHQDHIAGLDDVRPIIFRVNKELALYGQERVLNRIKKAFHYAFETHPYPGAPVLRRQRSNRVSPLILMVFKLPQSV